MYLKTVLDLSTGSVLQKPITGLPAAELVNHETLWLKNFLSKQTQQTYRAVFHEFCQLGADRLPRSAVPGHPGGDHQLPRSPALFYRLPDLGVGPTAGEGSLRGEGYLMLRLTVKGGRQKSVEVHHALRQALDRYLAMSGHGDRPESTLFLAVKTGQNKGQALRQQQVARIFAKYRKQAGLPASHSPHSARATCATNALNNGAQLEDVLKMLGHADIRTTQIYDRRKHQHKDSAVFAVKY